MFALMHELQALDCRSQCQQSAHASCMVFLPVDTAGFVAPQAVSIAAMTMVIFGLGFTNPRR